MAPVIIIGGSIGGLSSGVALLKAGFKDVQVFERSPTPLARGTGVGLDDISVSILWELLDGTPSGGAAILSKLAPMRLTEEREAITGNVLLRRDYPYNAVYWEEIYKLLLEGFLAAGGRVHFGAKAASVSQRTTAGQGGECGLDRPVRVVFEDGASIDGDILIAADGPRSKAYSQILPGGGAPKPMIYRGYTAIRGTLPRSALPEEAEQTLMAEFQDLGNCLYFVMGPVGHLVLYELGGGLLNWLMYINQPEPTFLETTQTTGPPPPDLLEDLYSSAEERWGPGIAWLLRNTKEPFMNDIYDRDPLSGLVEGRAALLGDAAHPITPHVAKGTCLAIQDAHALGKALQPAAADPTLIPGALADYEKRRLPEVARMVLASRHIGLVRNRLAAACSNLDSFAAVSAEEYSEMLASAGIDTDTLPLDPLLREMGTEAPTHLMQQL